MLSSIPTPCLYSSCRMRKTSPEESDDEHMESANYQLTRFHNEQEHFYTIQPRVNDFLCRAEDERRNTVDFILINTLHQKCLRAMQHADLCSENTKRTQRQYKSWECGNHPKFIVEIAKQEFFQTLDEEVKNLKTAVRNLKLENWVLEAAILDLQGRQRPIKKTKYNCGRFWRTLCFRLKKLFIRRRRKPGII